MMRLASIPSRFHYFFKKPENERDAVIRNNVIGSLIFQFLTNLLGLLVVPLSLSYIDKEKYGIWINASVMVTWLQNMNFGMGFGMQNKVAQAMANDKPELAKEYVSIVYRYSTLIAIGIFILGLVGSFFINWNALFNSSTPGYQLRTITVIAFLCFLAYFILGNIIPLFNALKQTSVPKFFGLVTNVLTVVFLFTIAKFSHNNLALAALALALPTPLVYLAGNIFFFKKKFRHLKPRWRIKDKKHVKDVFNLGLKFFLMQLTTLMITQSGVFIITQYLGPAEVTPYSVITRYFYFVFFIFSLAISPYWAGFTEAYEKNDFKWIKKTLSHLIFAGIGGSLAVLLMLSIAFWLIPIWSKHTFEISNYKTLVFAVAIHIITLFFATIISTFLSALSLLRTQLILQIFLSFFTVIVSIVFITIFNLGSSAVVITAILGQLFYIVICGNQLNNLIKKKSSEIIVNR